MRSSISIPRIESKFKPGVFVEIKKNKGATENYKGDYGQIIDVDNNSNQCIVKLVPRIDYKELLKIHDEIVQEGANFKLIGKQSQLQKEKGPFYQPPQADFNKKLILEFGGEVQSKYLKLHTGEKINVPGWMWDDNIFLGTFLFKKYRFNFFDLPKKSIPNAVLRKFEENIETINFKKTIPNFEVNMYNSLTKTTTAIFRPGDHAKVCHGSEYAGLEVLIKVVEGRFAKAQSIKHETEFNIEISFLERLFKDDDQVEIIDGPNTGETCQILDIKDNTANVLIDSSSIPCKVSTNQLVKATQMKKKFGKVWAISSL